MLKLQHMVFCSQFGWCTIQTVHTTYAAALKTTTHLQTGCTKQYAATSTSSAPDDGRMRPKHVELRKISINTLLHQVGISLYLTSGAT